MRECLRNLILATLLAVLVVPIALCGADPFVGTWILNPEKTTGGPGHPPQKAETLVAEEQDGGIKTIVDQVNAQGKPVHYEYIIKFDGKDYPIIGTEEMDTIATKRIDANTYEPTIKKDGKVLRTGRIVVSKDGKTRTSHWKEKNAKGELIDVVVVFEKTTMAPFSRRL